MHVCTCNIIHILYNHVHTSLSTHTLIIVLATYTYTVAGTTMNRSVCVYTVYWHLALLCSKLPHQSVLLLLLLLILLLLLQLVALCCPTGYDEGNNRGGCYVGVSYCLLFTPLVAYSMCLVQVEQIRCTLVN